LIVYSFSSRWPKLLFLSLSRFRFDSRTQQRVKLTTRVTSLLFLNVSENRYELLGIVFHLGSTPEHGHYTSLIRSDTHDSETKWFLTNDHIVSTRSDQVMSNIVSGIFPDDDITPYVLLYQLTSLI
jgi:ubiquitin C-terminal hydrolase